MSKHIGIDGIDFTQDAKYKFLIRYESTKDRADTVKFVDKITFTGSAFNYLNEIYFVNKSINKVCNVVMQGCCDYDFELKIDYRTVQLDGCYIHCTPISKVSDKYDQLKKTIWFSNNFHKDNQNFRVPYCVGFGFMQIIIMFLYFAFLPIIAIIKALPDWLVDSDDLGIDELERRVHGCGYYHVGYSLKEVLEYQCYKLNMGFESSILQNGIYANTVFVPCASGKGFGINQGGENFDFANAPAFTILQLLEIFKPVFNARYWIEDNVLKFERKDKYTDVQDYVIDVDVDEYKGNLTFEFSKESGYAYGRYEYNVDAIDQEGGDLAELYNDIVEWNSPPQEWQKGSLENVLKDFSPTTYMGAFGSSDVLDTMRSTLSGIYGIKAVQYMILPNGLSGNMKLIIADIDGSPLGKDLIRSIWKPVPGKDKKLYDYPLYFNENQYEPELYQNFHFIDDPRTLVEVEGGDIEFIPENFCNFVEIIDKYGVRVGVKSMYGIGLPEAIELDLEFGTAKLIKPVWRCPLVQ